MIINRYLKEFVIKDLSERMVFVGGPRRVGKTTLATELIAKSFNQTGYYNWDNRNDRRQIMQSASKEKDIL